MAASLQWCQDHVMLQKSLVPFFNRYEVLFESKETYVSTVIVFGEVIVSSPFLQSTSIAPLGVGKITS